jgi:hypothetical protein
MKDYKQAGDLVPDDVYILRRPYRDTTQDRIYRVITTRPGNAATVVAVIVESTEPQKGDKSAAL